MSNLNKEQILEKVTELKKVASQIGLTLDLDTNDIHEFRQDAIWYGGRIGGFQYGDYYISIDAIGDVRATLYNENDEEITTMKDRNNAGDFYQEMKQYILDDEQLFQYLGYTDCDSTKIYLSLEDNNWLEYNVYNTKTKQYVELPALSNILEGNDVLEAFEGLDDLIDYLLEEGYISK